MAGVCGAEELRLPGGVGQVELSGLLGHPGDCPEPGTLLLPWATAEGLGSSMPPSAQSAGLEAVKLSARVSVQSCSRSLSGVGLQA